MLNELEKRLDINNNFDIKKKKIKILNKDGYIFFTSSLINHYDLMFLMEFLDKIKSFKDFDLRVYNGEIKQESKLDTILEDVYSGFILLVIEEKYYLVDAKLYPNRSIEEPITEKTIRGSRDGFSESINTNIGLLRRRLKSEQLVAKSYSISSLGKTNVALCYIKGIADEDLINHLDEQLNKIDVDSLIMTDRSLEEILFKQKYTPFPLVRYTERPDVASISLMYGKIAIIVDTSASVILTPITIFDHTKHVEEFRQSPIVGSFTRMLRTFAIFLSLFLIPLWMCLVDNSEIVNSFKISISQNNLEIGVAMQIIIAQIIFEIVRLASIHTPTTLQTGISLISAVILGQVSMELGLFLPEVLLLCAISQICNFTTPSYELSMAIKLANIGLIVITAIFGKNGFIIFTTLLFLYLTSIKIWSVPYMYPVCPFDFKRITSIFLRNSPDNKKKL